METSTATMSVKLPETRKNEFFSQRNCEVIPAVSSSKVRFVHAIENATVAIPTHHSAEERKRKFFAERDICLIDPQAEVQPPIMPVPPFPAPDMPAPDYPAPDFPITPPPAPGSPEPNVPRPESPTPPSPGGPGIPMPEEPKREFPPL